MYRIFDSLCKESGVANATRAHSFVRGVESPTHRFPLQGIWRCRRHPCTFICAGRRIAHSSIPFAGNLALHSATYTHSFVPGVASPTHHALLFLHGPCMMAV